MVRAKHWDLSDSEDEFFDNGLSEEENECVTTTYSEPVPENQSKDEQDAVNNKRKSSESLDPPSKKAKIDPTLAYTIKRRRFQDNNNSHLQKGNQKVKKKWYNGGEFIVSILPESVVQITDVSNSLYLTFQNILSEILPGFSPSSLVHVCVSSSSLSHPISTKVLKSSVFSSEHIMATIENAVQSASEGICLDSSFQVTVKVLDTQTGGSLGPKMKENLSANCKNIITIEDNDNISMARAIVVALAKIRQDPKFKHLCDNRRSLQKKLAKELHQNAGVPEGFCSIEEAKVFANHLEIKITIVDPELEQKIISVGQENETEVYLWRIPQDKKYHYNVITKINSILKNKKINSTPIDKIMLLRKMRTFLVKELPNMVQKYICTACRLNLDDMDLHVCGDWFDIITLENVEKVCKEILFDKSIISKFAKMHPGTSGVKNIIQRCIKTYSPYDFTEKVLSYIRNCEIASKDGVESLYEFIDNYECV